jgi:hypothetical protein
MEGVARILLWKKFKTTLLVVTCLMACGGASTLWLRKGMAEQPPAKVAPAAKARGKIRKGTEPPAYRVEVRLMEALKEPSTFHSDRELIWFPAMVMADDMPMSVSLSQENTGYKTFRGTPPEDKSTVSLCTSIRHQLVRQSVGGSEVP